MTPTVPTFLPSPPRGVWYVGKIWHLDLFGRQLDIGPIPIRAYALCIIAGIVVALLIGDRRWRARGGERGVIYDIALWAVPFGLVGGRLYHLMTDWRTYFGEDGAGFDATLRIWDGGLGIWGAVALGGVGAWIGCRRHGIPLPPFADAIAPGIVLAQAIGRLGNYFNQELYGRETSQPWGLEIFWRHDVAGLRDPHLLDGVSTGEVYRVVEPTFAYELIWNVLVFLLLIVVDRRFKIGHGRLFALYVAGYCVGRFGIELLRADAATHIAGIRINSFTSTFVFIGAVVYFLLAPKGRENPAELSGSAEEAFHEEEIPVPEGQLVGVAAGSGAGALESVEPLAEDAIDLWSADAVEPDSETGLDAEFATDLIPDAAKGADAGNEDSEDDEDSEDSKDDEATALAEGAADETAEDQGNETTEAVEEPAEENVEEAAEGEDWESEAVETDAGESATEEPAADSTGDASADAMDDEPGETAADAPETAEAAEAAATEQAEEAEEKPPRQRRG